MKIRAWFFYVKKASNHYTSCEKAFQTVGIGPIFATKSKADAIQSSLAFLQAAREAEPHFPIVAIGGTTTKNSLLVRKAGANGVAVIRVITKSTNIAHTVANL